MRRSSFAPATGTLLLLLSVACVGAQVTPGATHRSLAAADPSGDSAAADSAAVERYLAGLPSAQARALGARLLGLGPLGASPAPSVSAALSAPAPSGWDTVGATAWFQSSAEARGEYETVYRAATQLLPAVMKERTRSAAPEQTSVPPALPPAVILDIDETVLDNSPFQARLIHAQKGYDREEWNKWCSEGRAAPLAGAVEFTQAARKAGVTVFYVTNRTAELEEPTRKNLATHAFPLDATVDTVLTRGERPEWGGDKGTRRRFVADKYRIIMLFGDNLGDFTDEYHGDVAARRKVVEAHREDWGRRWFMLPNPMYGSWEEALAGKASRDAGQRARAFAAAVDESR